MSAAALKACYNTTQYNKSIYNARMVSLRAASDSGLHPLPTPILRLFSAVRVNIVKLLETFVYKIMPVFVITRSFHLIFKSC